MKKFCYLNGKIKPLAQAGVALNDIGLLRGYAVFDFIRTYNGKPFHFADHFKRFKNSAKVFGLQVPVTEQGALKIIQTLMHKNKCLEASIRMVLTGGPTSNGFAFSKKTPTFFILLEDIYNFPPAIFKKGGKLITVNYERDLPETKNTNYLNAIFLQPKKKQAGAVEILYLKGEKVLEASTSTIFFFEGNNLITPNNGVLKGITAKVVMKLAQKKFKVMAEDDIKLKRLLKVDEVFITATNKKITPIVQIDQQKIGSGQVGEKTKQLMSLFEGYIEQY